MRNIIIVPKYFSCACKDCKFFSGSVESGKGQFNQLVLMVGCKRDELELPSDEWEACYILDGD